jgi:hypothetical protein
MIADLWYKNAVVYSLDVESSWMRTVTASAISRGSSVAWIT